MDEQTTEQPIVEITTRLDYEEFKKYARYVHLRTKNILLSILSIVLYPTFIFLFLLPVVAVLHALGIELPDAALPGILWGLYSFSALFFMFFLYISVMEFRAAIRSYKKHQRYHEADSHEVFYEEFIHTHMELPEITSDHQIRYSYYAEAIETKSAFYLTLTHDKNQHGIFPKKYITEDQTAALRDLFARKFGERFKTKL